MPLEEVSFRNIVGEEVNLTNLVLQMIDYYDMKREIGETRLTDFNEGSEIRNLLEAYAVLVYAYLEDMNEAGKLPFIELSSGVYLDRIGANPFINLPRVMGEVATGEVTFTLAEAQDTDVIIPAQTILEDSVNGLEFITIDDCTIPAGELSEDMSVECLTEGVDGNVASGTLTVITDDGVDTGLVSVTNSEALDGGEDYEDDEVYRVRLLENVRADGFGTVGYYTALGGGVDGVHDVKLTDDADYTRKVLVNGDSKPTPDRVLLDVLEVFSVPSNIVMNHTFIIDRPFYETVDLTVNLDVAVLLDEDMLDTVLDKFFDGGSAYEMEFEGLNIDESIDKSRLYGVFETFEDVLNVSVEYDGEEVSVIDCPLNSVLKLGTATFNQTEV